jgi:hypothetical protein
VSPKPGDLLLITVKASVQFVACDPFLFRLIRQLDWTTYQGWVWLDGYQLDANVVARQRRSIFVQLAGLIHVKEPAKRSHTRRRQTVATHRTNTRPAITRTRPRPHVDAEPDRS